MVGLSTAWRAVLKRGAGTFGAPRKDHRLVTSPVFRQLFDADYYRLFVPRGIRTKAQMIDHFVSTGLAAGLRPNALFDPDFYGFANPDAAERHPPFRHFCLDGAREGRDPHPLFVTAHYLSQFGDGDRPEFPFLHYLREGWRSGLDPNPDFPISRYLEQNPECVASGIDPLTHFVLTGGSPARPRWHQAPRHEGRITWREIGAPLPVLATAFEKQGAELIAAAALCERQATQLDAMAHGLARVQGIADLLDARNRALSEQLRSVEFDDRADPAWRPFFSSTRALSVLFVSASPNNPSHEYRVGNYVAALGEAGVEARWLPDNDLAGILAAIDDVSIVIAWRVALTPELSSVVLKCRRSGVPVVFDIDDYVFEPRIANPTYVDGLRSLARRETALYQWGVLGYRRFLLACDAVITTTGLLADQARALGRVAYVLPNGLDSFYQAEALAQGEQVASALKADDKVRIGYTPGSRTHQKDFRQCSGVIARVLRENPGARLTIVGDLDLSEFPEFDGLAGQIEEDMTIGRSYLRSRIPDFDVHIAPVELGNPFTEAKSELKFFEPAIFSIPTIASATRPFVEAIDDGRTGFVARTQEDWYRALTTLVTDSARREEIGRLARATASERYGLARLGRLARDAIEDIVGTARRGTGLGDKALSILVLADGVPGAGVDSLPAYLARGLAELGHAVRLHLMEATPNAPLMRVIQSLDLMPGTSCTAGALPARPVDVVLATSSATAIALSERPLLGLVKIAVLATGATSDAERSILADIRRASPAMAVIACDSEGASALDATLTLPPSLNRLLFTSTDLTRGRPAIAAYCDGADEGAEDSLIVAALTRLRDRSDGACEITLFGEPCSAAHPGLSHAGRLGPFERATLFRSVSIGISLSRRQFPDIALEMRACGLPVLADRSLDADGIAAWIAARLGDEDLRETEARASLDSTRDLPDETAAIDALEAFLLRRIETFDEARDRSRQSGAVTLQD